MLLHVSGGTPLFDEQRGKEKNGRKVRREN